MSIVGVMLHSGSNCESYMVRITVRVMMKVHGSNNIIVRGVGTSILIIIYNTPPWMPLMRMYLVKTLLLKNLWEKTGEGKSIQHS